MTTPLTYDHPDDLPVVIPVFPLIGVLLLPRTELPLNIFEPRYLKMIDNAMSGDRVIGMCQPISIDNEILDDPNQKPEIHNIGCLGQITSFTKTNDGRALITLTGICRYRTHKELDSFYSYRQVQADYEPYLDDLKIGHNEASVDRQSLIDTFKLYAKIHKLGFKWSAISDAPTEALINGLAMTSPYGLAEKQALLEAPDLKTRAETLIALTEMSLAEKTSVSNPTLQ